MCAAITSAVLATGMAGYQIYQGNKQKNDANRALSEYERQELDNAYKNIQISTMGSDLLRDENARTSAGLIDAMQQGGSRAIIGGVPRVVGATTQISREAAKMIDDQVMNREYAIAGEESRIQNITENRDIANINGLSSQAQAGQQDMWSGMMGMTKALSYGAKNINTPEGIARRDAWEKFQRENPNSEISRSDFMEANPKDDFKIRF